MNLAPAGSAPRELIFSVAETALAARTVLRKDALYPIETFATRLRATTAPPLQVAVVGPFSAGKSTFINAFIGRLERTKKGDKWTYTGPLDAARLAKTALVTEVHRANNKDQEQVVAVHRDGRKELISYNDAKELAALRDGQASNEDVNKIVIAKRRSIQSLRIYLTLPDRLTGIVFVDTPGLDSMFDEHTTLAEEAIRRSDAVLYLVDEHITSSDKRTLIDVKDWLGNVIFVQTQCDLQRSDADIAELVGSNAAAISQWLQVDPPAIIALSAFDEATARAGKGVDTGDLETAGFREAQSMLARVLHRSSDLRLADAQRRAYTALEQILGDIRTAKMRLQEPQIEANDKSVGFEAQVALVQKAVASLSSRCDAYVRDNINSRAAAWVVRIRQQVDGSRNGWNAAENTALHIQRVARLLYDTYLKREVEALMIATSDDVGLIVEEHLGVRIPKFVLPSSEPKLSVPILKVGLVRRFLSWLGMRISESQVEEAARSATDNILEEVTRIVTHHIARLREQITLYTDMHRSRIEAEANAALEQTAVAAAMKSSQIGDISNLEEIASRKLADLRSALSES